MQTKLSFVSECDVTFFRVPLITNSSYSKVEFSYGENSDKYDV